jgi:hypothetical protein
MGNTAFCGKSMWYVVTGGRQNELDGVMSRDYGVTNCKHIYCGEAL